jgi:hypothetical protein
LNFPKGTLFNRASPPSKEDFKESLVVSTTACSAGTVTRPIFLKGLGSFPITAYPLPWREGIKGRGISSIGMTIILPHPLPSREREFLGGLQRFILKSDYEVEESFN